MAGRKHKQGKEELYEIDAIVDSKQEGGKVLYKIHWKGYDHRHDTWEPESVLVDCQVVIDDFKKSQKAKDITPPKEISSTALSSDDEGTPKRTKKAIHKNLRTLSPSRSRAMPRNQPQSEKPVKSTRGYTPGRYYFRNSTLSQRIDETNIFSSDDETETSLSRRQLHKRISTKTRAPDTPINEEDSMPSVDLTAPVIPPAEVNPPDPAIDAPPTWLQLGFAELFFCLALLAIIVGILYYYSDYFSFKSNVI